MIILDCPQGSPEWHAARAGALTASDFRTARSRAADGVTMTKAARHLAFRKAIERISGKPYEDAPFETWQMKRGQRLEDDARLLHSAEIGLRVRPVGIILTDDRKFGASADGNFECPVDGRGGSEYKCLVGPEILESIYIDNDTDIFDDQVYGNLWLSARDFWDFCVYCPMLESIGLHFWRRRKKRDEAYIERLESDLIDFDRVIETVKWKLLCVQARNEGRPMPDPPEGVNPDKFDCPFDL